MIQTSRRKASLPWNGKFEGDVQPLKGASDREELSVSLTRYPDTNPEFFRSYIANPELRWPQAAAELTLGLDGRGARPHTRMLLSLACSDIFC